jgi:hypothetical protein
MLEAKDGDRSFIALAAGGNLKSLLHALYPIENGAGNAGICGIGR